MVFGTSAGLAAFEAYKNKSPLPENIAHENGHEKIAAYLRNITERYLDSKLFQLAIMRTIHISMTSTFQFEYCQCFTFKRCDKFKPKMY